jgi:5-methylcytosine-specific restriction endonuclease McrA
VIIVSKTNSVGLLLPVSGASETKSVRRPQIVLDVNKTENAFALMAALTLNAYVVLKGIFTKQDIERLWGAQAGQCAHCAVSLLVSCNLDHKTPLSRGGSNWPDNLQLLCRSCNSCKGAKTMDERLCQIAASTEVTRNLAA